MNTFLLYAPYQPNLLTLLLIVLILVLLLPRWGYNYDWSYRPLGTVILIVLLIWILLSFTGCTNTTGTVNANATVNPNDPGNVSVVVGGQLNFSKKAAHYAKDSK